MAAVVKQHRASEFLEIDGGTPRATVTPTVNAKHDAVLRHAVGKSTIQEGFTVPRNLENWLNAPAAGQKRTVVLHFDEHTAPATLRRLANARGHVQVKYENEAGRPFREWLTRHFELPTDASRGDFIELSRISADEYRVRAFPAVAQPKRHLDVDKWLFHRTDCRVLERHAAVREIPAIMRNIGYDASKSQNYYNQLLSSRFVDWAWVPEKLVIPELLLRCDFTKDTAMVEVEFGNARTYYQDFIKFMLSHNRRSAEIGKLVVPSLVFARHLCDVGRKRAMASGRQFYSGMMHFEKVRRELEYLKFMLSMPIAVAGIGEANPPTLFTPRSSIGEP